MIEFEHVTKRYPDGTVAVGDLSLTIPSGEITVFVGPSGCGKTTSLRMVNRMIDPTGGRITVDGVDIAGQDPALLRRGIGYVIQNAGLFPHRTVLDNVATVPRLVGATRREARERAQGLLERVGLDPALAKRYPGQLSGGQQQRVGVARALAADPPVLLMDEPFSAVDPVVRDSLQRELLALQQDLGKTVVLVTHDIDEAIKLGDHVAVFATGGRLAQYATPETLLADPADDFVATFVGRDRGFRGLSFDTAENLPVVPVTEQVQGVRLLLDESARPLAWQDETGGSVPVVGTWQLGDSLRVVADLALLSPAGAAVRVDAEGRADAMVTSTVVAEVVQRRQRARLLGEGVAVPAPSGRRVMSLLDQTWEYWQQNRETIVEALQVHTRLALVPVVIAFVVSLPLGWAVVRYGWVRHPLLTLSSIMYTIPSLALFLVLPGILGTGILDPTNVVVALTLYSAALLVRTTADGLASVDQAVVRSATALGYRPLRRWFTVDLPLSLPVVLAGLRVATVANVSMVSMASLIGIGGLGQLFTRGFQLGFYLPPILIGLVLSVLLALVADVVIVLAQRLLTPWERVGVNR